MRKFIFDLLFTEMERISIINALWIRALNESEQNNIEQNQEIMPICKDLAKELM